MLSFFVRHFWLQYMYLLFSFLTVSTTCIKRDKRNKASTKYQRRQDPEVAVNRILKNMECAVSKRVVSKALITLP